MSFTKLIRNEVFSLSTICFIAIPLIISYSNSKDIKNAKQQRTAKETIPSITKIVKSNEITKTIYGSINTIKNIKIPNGKGSNYGNKTYKTKHNNRRSGKLYVNR